MEQEQSSQALTRWQDAVDEMRRLGVTHGTIYEAEWFEQQLSCSRGSLKFDSAIRDIRAALEIDGVYLSAYDRNKARFVILVLESNSNRILAYQRHADRNLRRTVVRGGNTRLFLLSESRRRRHEATLERIAKRTALIGRYDRHWEAAPTDAI